MCINLYICRRLQFLHLHFFLSLWSLRGISFGKMKPCGPFILFSLISAKAYSTCYFPDGTDANKPLPSPVFQPCDSSGGDSMCCALNRPSPDKCRSDGLCESQLDLNVWRESCTDPSWKSPKCIQLCTNGICKWLPSPRTRLSIKWLLSTKGNTRKAANFSTLIAVMVQ